MCPFAREIKKQSQSFISFLEKFSQLFSPGNEAARNFRQAIISIIANN